MRNPFSINPDEATPREKVFVLTVLMLVFILIGMDIPSLIFGAQP